MISEKIVTVNIKLSKLFFPKNKNQVTGDENDSYAIFSAKITNVIDNEYTEDKNIRNGGTVKLKGNIYTLKYDEVYKASISLSEDDANWGRTYAINTINRVVNLDTYENQFDFLNSVIGYPLAKTLMQEFDTKVIDILESENVEELTKIKGIGAKKANKIIKSYNSTKDISSIYIELKKANLTSIMINKLLEHYKSPEKVVYIVKNDPYQMVDVGGIGFTRADEIALKMGMSPLDKRRIKGFVINYMKENGENGKSWVEWQDVVDEMYYCLNSTEQELPLELLTDSMWDLIHDKKVKIVDETGRLALMRYYKLEENIYKQLVRLSKANSKVLIDKSNLSEQIHASEVEQDFVFTDEQRDAIIKSVDNNIIAITGSAGCGKSSTANGIAKIYNQDYKIVGCALSGQASLRLQQAMNNSVECSTIHKLLGWTNGKFTRDENYPLECDIVIIDESTMINGNLFYSLLKAIPTGAKVIMLGDIQQLTPIGNCQVFGDILTIENDLVLTVRLTKIHRQAAKSGIITTSQNVINGTRLFPTTFDGENVVGELKDMFFNIYTESSDLSDDVCNTWLSEFEKVNRQLFDIQICVPKKLNGSLACYNLNNKIQNIVNPYVPNKNEITIKVGSSQGESKTYSFREGDKVINRKNNYRVSVVNINEENQDYDDESFDIFDRIFNGAMGIVSKISDDRNWMIIDFIGYGLYRFYTRDIQNLELAYACTVHSLQGSGFKTVIVAIDNSSYIMNNSEMLYTAITRARKKCFLIGVNDAIQHCIVTKSTRTKKTLLGEFLSNKLKIE